MLFANLNYRTVQLAFVYLFCCAFLFIQTTAEGAPQASGLVELQSPNIQTLVHTGNDLERSGQWYEAIEHYEGALKKQPDNKQLKSGLRRSKIHFSISQRYTDSSFEDSMVHMSRPDALRLFDEVLQQISNYYVDRLHQTNVVAHGTESLYRALENEKFLTRNIPNASSDRIEQVRAILRENYWNKSVSGGRGAQQTISEVCDYCENYLGLASGPVVMEYVFGGCNALDDYSSILTPNRSNDLRGNINGEFVGLGIEMKAEPGKGLLLVNVLPDSPAEEGGMQAGDHIVSVESIDCRNLTTAEGAKYLRGLPGSRVWLKVQSPNGQAREGSFMRRSVQVKSIPVAQIIDRSNGVGYIRMTGFQRSTVEELDTALLSLQRQGMRSLIWDLRGNPGGLLTTSAEVLDRFIDKGVLVSTRGRNNDQNWSYSAHRLGTYQMPMVLLVDGNSASASEIVAGAIRDYNRGMIVGRKTYGKWSVQTILDTSHSTALRLTTAKFYSPKGRNLSKIGLHPDVTVQLSGNRTTFYRAPRKVDLVEDADLRKGLEVLRSQISRR